MSGKETADSSLADCTHGTRNFMQCLRHFNYSLWGYSKQHSVRCIPRSLPYIMTVKFQLQRCLKAQWLFNHLLEDNFQMWQRHQQSSWVGYIYFFLHLVCCLLVLLSCRGRFRLCGAYNVYNCGESPLKKKTVQLQLQLQH